MGQLARALDAARLWCQTRGLTWSANRVNIMVVLGWRTRTRTQGTGTFHCPTEDGRRRYRIATVHRWLRIGRMPVFPLRQVSTFVECRSCRSTFTEVVLDQDAVEPVENVLTSALRCAVPMVLGEVDLGPSRRREAVIVLQRYTNVPYSSRDLEIDLRGDIDDTASVELGRLATSLNDHGRHAVLDAAVQLAATPGGLDSASRERVRRVATALSQPCDRVRRTIDQRLQATAVAC